MPKHQKTSQSHINKLHPSAYGGSLRNKRSGRGQRTISTRHSMHLVLRSSIAKGAWSFARAKNRDMVQRVLTKHAKKTNVELIGTGNAGNHLHLKLRFTSREQYKHFIRAVTGEIALHIKRIINPDEPTTIAKRNFWDHRPFSSIVSTLKYAARLKDYLMINQMEGRGLPRQHARLVVQSLNDPFRWNKQFGWDST